MRITWFHSAVAIALLALTGNAARLAIPWARVIVADRRAKSVLVPYTVVLVGRETNIRETVALRGDLALLKMTEHLTPGSAVSQRMLYMNLRDERPK